jgi:hypothetical protein
VISKTDLYTKGHWLNTICRAIVLPIFWITGLIYSQLFRKYNLISFNNNLLANCTREQVSQMPVDLRVQSFSNEPETYNCIFPTAYESIVKTYQISCINDHHNSITIEEFISIDLVFTLMSPDIRSTDLFNKLTTIRARQNASKKELKEIYIPLPIAVAIEIEKGSGFSSISLTEDIQYSIARILPAFLFKIAIPKDTRSLSFIDIALLSQGVINKKIDIICVN